MNSSAKVSTHRNLDLERGSESLVRGYNAINLIMRWDTIENELPPLVEQLEAIAGIDPGRPDHSDQTYPTYLNRNSSDRTTSRIAASMYG